MDKIVSAGNKISFIKDRRADGTTPLYDAVKLDRFDEVESMLNGGHDGINKKACVNGYTPFYLALSESNFRIVKLMLDEKFGARFDLKTTSSCTEKAPHVLVKGCNFDSIESFKDFLSVLEAMIRSNPYLLHDDKNIVYLFLKKMHELSSQYAESNSTIPYSMEVLVLKMRDYLSEKKEYINEVLGLFLRGGATVNSIKDSDYKHLLFHIMHWNFPSTLLDTVTGSPNFDPKIWNSWIKKSREGLSMQILFSRNPDHKESLEKLLQLKETPDESKVNEAEAVVP